MERENCRLEQYYYPLQLNVMEMLSWGKMDGDVIDAASQTAAVKTYEVIFICLCWPYWLVNRIFFHDQGWYWNMSAP